MCITYLFGHEGSFVVFSKICFLYNNTRSCCIYILLGFIFSALNSFLEIYAQIINFQTTCFKFLMLSKKADNAKLCTSYVEVTVLCSKDCKVG